MLKFNQKLQVQFERMCETGKLFRSEMTGNEVWDLYLSSFEQDPIFRDPESSVHNCNLCKNFIRRYGNIVAIAKDSSIITMFDFIGESEFANVSVNLDYELAHSKVKEVFFETFNELNSLNYESCKKSNAKFRLGINRNVKRYTKEEAEKFGGVKANDLVTFNHMFLNIPALFVDQSGKSVESIMADYRSAKEVFQRAMETISLDTLLLVRDLINQVSLLNGEAHLYKVEQFIPLKKEYDTLSAKDRDNWCWANSYKLPFAKFKNELIGVLCSELSEGKELNAACQSWNKRVDPINYMKTAAPITKKQIAEAQAFVEENGYVESFDRRFATIDDINVSEILHSNVGDGSIQKVSIFDTVKSSVSTQHKRSEFDKVEEISIEKFMKDIVPNCTSIEAFLGNQHSGNMVSLTTANVKESKPIFKWNNNYSWTFAGNIAGKSMIKEAIKDRGGKTEGVVNIRLHFPNTESDYDLHVVEPQGGSHIYYSNRREKQRSSGMLDLDAQGCDGMFSPEKRVENVIYTDQSKMPVGSYLVYVNNYTLNDNNFGFIVEIEINGEVSIFNYNTFIARGANVNVCRVEFDGENFTIKPIIPIGESNSISKEIYGLNSNEFHKVNLLCVSPNHWEGNCVGNKHYFFMLDKCKAQTLIRSFHSENLIPELVDHRRVLEVLGNTTMIEPVEKQLSGLGFNATVHDELIVKVQGSFKRMLKIKF